jgi:hypothetical protein
MHTKRLSLQRHLALLLAALVISCGGGGDGGSTGPSPTPSPTPSPSPSPTLPAAGAHIEESDPTVTFTGVWTNTESKWGYSGGTAVQSSMVGATASFVFTGTSVRWMSTRGRTMGQARVSVDGGPAKVVQLKADMGDIIRTPAIVMHDLSDGPHTLTIEVLSGIVVVDSFDVQPETTISLWQDTNPEVAYSAGWTKAAVGGNWSGTGNSNQPELPVTAMETYAAGETVTLPFRGTAIIWNGYRSPDSGIALVQVDGGTPVEVDLYSPTAKFQAAVFTATGLADTNHTLTITTTGGRNPAASNSRVVVDAFEVITPGRRYENNDPAVTYGGADWTPNHVDRVWSGGSAATSNRTGHTATFSFTGTSVSWIGCRKNSAGGTVNVYIDGVFVRAVDLRGVSYPREGYQMTVFRQDGLANGPHTLTVEVTSRDEGPYVVIDAFDVHR